MDKETYEALKRTIIEYTCEICGKKGYNT